MKKKPLVSVYILNYNYGKYLCQCLESVLAQTYQNIEVIYIDDGSSDNSKDLIRNYKNKNKIKVIEQENIGFINSIKKAISLCSGKYIIRVDADDWINSEMIEKLVNKINEDEKVKLVFPDYYEVNEKGDIIHEIRRHKFTDEIFLLDQPAHGACTLICKDAFYEVGGYTDGIICQDGVDVWLKIIKKYKVKNISEPLFYYRKHGKSLSDNSEKILDNRVKIFESHYKKETSSIPQKNICVIFARSEIYDNVEFLLKPFLNTNLLSICLNNAFSQKIFHEIHLSTDSEELAKYAITHFPDVCIHKRNSSQTAYFTSLYDSLIDFKQTVKCDNIITLMPHYPFLNAKYLSYIVYYKTFFNVPEVISTYEDASVSYLHDGNSLNPVSNSEIRNERDKIYLRRGVLNLYDYDLLSSGKKIKNNLLRGHINLDKLSSFEIDNVNTIDYFNKTMSHV